MKQNLNTLNMQSQLKFFLKRIPNKSIACRRLYHVRISDVSAKIAALQPSHFMLQKFLLSQSPKRSGPEHLNWKCLEIQVNE